jgi:hypothetical protein
MRNFCLALCSGVALGLIACSDLGVKDVTDPDRNRVLGTPADVEAFIGATYAQIQNATLGGSNDDIQTQLQVEGMENVSGLANFAMGPRGAIPRNPIDNTRGSQGNAGNLRDFQVLHRAARMATIGIARLKVLTLGSPAQDARARMFARFSQGVALGNLSLVYDSASILTEDDDPQATIPLSGYRAVNTAALGYLDSALAIATSTPGAFPLPNTWINGVAVTQTQMVQLIHSYKARLRASVARSPTDTVDWAAVIADANAGITSDFSIAMNPAAGWDVVWPIQAYATGSANWHQMSQFWLGMGDVSGKFDAWLATPSSRAPFTVVSPDLRLPQGADRASQIGDTLRTGFKTFAGRPYVRNRPSGEDQPGDPFMISQYDFYRSRAFFVAGRIGNYPVMTAAEIRLLAAEAYLQPGPQQNFAQAQTLINVTRADANKGGLPALSGITDTLTAVPGGAGCVPRVPDAAAGFKATKCGNIWDALKWEYRLETAYTGYGMWYFAARRWGDLPEGTPIQWPVPYQEMDARGKPFYPMGGLGNAGSAGPGNYGLKMSGGVF